MNCRQLHLLGWENTMQRLLGMQRGHRNASTAVWHLTPLRKQQASPASQPDTPDCPTVSSEMRHVSPLRYGRKC